MLVLSRKLNEQIVINENITITIVEIRGDRVRIGIDAPKDAPIRRAELAARDVADTQHKRHDGR